MVNLKKMTHNQKNQNIYKENVTYKKNRKIFFEHKTEMKAYEYWVFINGIII